MIKFDVFNRWSDLVQFTASLDCAKDAPVEIKHGLSVKWAIKMGASLVGANLVGASLAGASLVGESLEGANLDGANLAGASLDDANLDDASLVGANLAGASLAGASLVGANLVRASLADANLAGASLAGASLDDASLVRASLVRASLIVGGQRSDGYRFLLFRERDGAVKVSAGCRYFSIAEARAHWLATREKTTLGDESQALVDDLERRAKIAGWNG